MEVIKCHARQHLQDEENDSADHESCGYFLNPLIHKTALLSAHIVVKPSQLVKTTPEQHFWAFPSLPKAAMLFLNRQPMP
jgi:hypothetical protein